MEKNKAQEIVIDAIQPCLNSDMQITDNALDTIVKNCHTAKNLTKAMHHVQTWFNGRDVAGMERGEQEAYVGAVVNLLALLASGHIDDLVLDWILCDLNL